MRQCHAFALPDASATFVLCRTERSWPAQVGFKFSESVSLFNLVDNSKTEVSSRDWRHIEDKKLISAEARDGSS